MIEQVGSGAMGVVWKADDERLGRTVAIKRLLVRYALSEARSEETRRRAMREARIAARLQHRNAIAMFDVAEHEGDPCLVMEFLPSRSLSAVLAERGTLPPDEVAEIGAQVASALAAAHAVGIVHRDVKPGNILLAENGTVKITDFGISKALDDGTVTTQTGIAGTPAYLAPEIARGEDPGRASDVYSLGSTLYHALEGRPPFGTNSNPLALLHAVASGNALPSRNAGPLADTLSTLMRPDPATRPTMSAAAAKLANPAAAKAEPATPAAPAHAAPAEPTRPVVAVLPTPPPRPPQPHAPAATPTTPDAPPPRTTDPSRRNLTVVAFAALLVVASVVTAILLLDDDRKSPGNAAPGEVEQTTTQRAEPPQEPTTTTSTPADDASTSKVDEPIDFSEAGRLVIEYYGDVQDVATRFAMLSGSAQAQFGGQEGFRQYWSQYTRVSSENAQGVTENADGSVNVPVDVTYTKGDNESRQHQQVRVTRVNGELLIDSRAV